VNRVGIRVFLVPLCCT